MSLWVFGGQQRPAFDRARAWEGLELAVVLRIDDDGRPKRVFEYRSAAAVTPAENAMQCFTASTIVGDRAYLCAATEVLVCTFPEFAILRTISLPFFNDLHHVAVGPSGTLFVVVTGLDAVAEVTPAGGLVRLISTVDGQDVWDRFSASVDYRRQPSTKPHASHPNFVFFIKGRACVTRFEQRDAVYLDDLRPVAAFHAGAHDGCVVGDEVYFTTVDGHIVRVRHSTGCVKDLDLNEIADEPRYPLGWCRGILPRHTRAWVAFSRLRFSRTRKNLSWVKHGFKPSYVHRNPTRIAEYDLERRELLREIDLEPVGVNAVFSIHEA